MSQNPYNPYEQQPPDPNATPGTSYGSPPPPAQGQGQSPYYNPYSPGQNPPDQNPNYAPYNPYPPNPPTPGPAVNPNYNPYDQYAPTQVGQGAQPGYNSFPPQAPPPLPPTQPRSRGLSGRLILLVALALVIIVGGLAIGLVSYNTTQTNNANATATAQTGTQTAHSALTATAQTNATATTVATNYPFSANQVLSDPLTDNSKGVQWQTSDFCKFLGSAYHVIDPQTNTYQPCLALNTNYSDFTFQVEMNISKGDGGGLLFRGNEASNQFYRFEIDAKGDYAIFVSVDPTGTNTRTLKSGTFSQQLNDTNTLSVVARGSTISVYVNPQQNSQPVATINDSTYSHGQIGFVSYNNTNSADIIFTNAKVWALPPGS